MAQGPELQSAPNLFRAFPFFSRFQGRRRGTAFARSLLGPKRRQEATGTLRTNDVPLCYSRFLQIALPVSNPEARNRIRAWRCVEISRTVFCETPRLTPLPSARRFLSNPSSLFISVKVRFEYICPFEIFCVPWLMVAALFAAVVMAM